MASELAEHVNKMVNEIFAKFKVEKIVRSDVTHYLISHGETRCLQITFSDNFSILHINKLETCGDTASGRNGKSLMELMDRLAASIPNLKYIELQDASELVFCGALINLAHLKILTSENAESWYGSLGYKSPTDETDKENNQHVRNMTVDKAFSYGIIKPSEYDSYKDQKMKFFGDLETDKMSVKDYVNVIFDSIREFKNPRKCTLNEIEKSTFVHTTINALGKLLIHGGKEWHQQSPILKKPIRTGGTKRKCRASRKRASRKRASRKHGKSRRN